MPNHDQIIAAETKNIKAVLARLRGCFPTGMPDLEIVSEVLQNGHGECNPSNLEAFARKNREFSTAEVMQYFQVSKYKAAGSLAALSGIGKIKKTGVKDDNGYSLYMVQ